MRGAAQGRRRRTEDGFAYAVASESVKDRIERLIQSEDPRRPLSDQRIAEMLKVANIDIARRTVTKYRAQLGMLPSSKRKKPF